MKIAIANSQLFQSLYIDTDAKKTRDKVVLIEETMETLSEAQGVLHSMMKEPYYGLVISGSNINVTKFRSKIYDKDVEECIGGLEIADILSVIAEVAFQCKCEISHFKGPIKYDKLPESMVVAFDFKSLFDTEKIKKAGNQFWKNLTGFNEDLEKKYQELDMEEHKKLMDYLDKNEGSIKDLQKAIKDSGQKVPKIEKLLDELKVDENFVEYLGGDWEKYSYYLINKQNIKEDIGTEYNDKDLRDIVRRILEDMPNSYGRVRADNLLHVGSNDINVVVIMKSNDSYDFPWWPSKGPIKYPTLDLLKKFEYDNFKV